MSFVAKIRLTAPIFGTLRWRISVALALAVALFAAGIYYFTSWYFHRVFAAAEEEDVRCHLTRYRGAIAERLRELRRLLEQPSERQAVMRLLAMSDDNFCAEQNRLALPDPRRRWLALIAEDGAIRACRGYDAELSTLLPLPPGLAEHFAASSPLHRRLQKEKTATGLLLLPDDPPLLIAAAAIEDEGKPSTLVAAQALYLHEISRLCQPGYLSVSLWRWDATEAETARRLLVDAARDDVATAAGPEETAAFSLLRDIYGQPALLLAMRLPRLVYGQAWLGVEYSTIVLLFIGVVTGFLFILFFDLSVLRRLSRTREAVEAIKRGELDPRAFILTGKDELDRLGAAVVDMAQSLQEYQAGLRQARALLEQKVEQRRAELAEANCRLQEEMEERQRLETAVQRAEKMAELASLAASVSQAVEEPLAALRSGVAEIENLMASATIPPQADILLRLKSLAIHSRRLTAVLDQVRCLIRGREMRTQWRTDLAPCLAEALAAFAVACPSAPEPIVFCEEQMPLLAVPAIPLQHMIVYLLEALASVAGSDKVAVSINVKRDDDKVLVHLLQPRARLQLADKSPWRLILAQALALSWDADYRLTETAQATEIELRMPVANA